MRARAIITGNAPGGKKDLLPEAFLYRRKLLSFQERPFLVQEPAAEQGKHARTHQHQRARLRRSLVLTIV